MKKSVLSGILFIGIFLILALPVLAGNPPDQTKSTLTSTAAPADGTTSSSVTITLRDVQGNTITTNDSITLTSSEGSAVFDPSSFTLDGSGIITTHMKTTAAGTVQLFLTDASAGNKQLSWGVPFYQPGTSSPTPTSTPGPNTCTDAAPGSTAALTSAVSAGPHAITLTWTDASNPVTYYLLSYGLASGSYIYGVPNIGGQGVTSFTVGGLQTGTKYYFVVRAGNGCTPGNFSNELSAIAGGSPSTTPVVAETTAPIDTPTGTPTDTPLPAVAQNIPVPTPTPAGDSAVGTVVTVGTVLGVLILIGVGIWAVIVKRGHPTF